MDKCSILNNVCGYKLDEMQRRIVLSNSKYTLVNAGAGSGKTLLIVGKVLYLIKEKNINPNEILCISFTNDSVNSLKNKINICGYNVEVFTFHKLGLNILNMAGCSFSIISSDFLEYLVDEYLNFIIISDSFYNKFLKKYVKSKDILKKEIISFIKVFKSYNYSYSKLINIYDSFWYSKKYRFILLLIIKIFYEYQLELNSSGMIDFDDMINNSIVYVDSVSFNYKYIIVDEYQDTSFNRYCLIKKILDKTNASFLCVGDDFQSIYGFSGANIDMFLNFKSFFPNGEVFKLENVYRNSSELIKVAGDFIMRNRFQMNKKLCSNKSVFKPIKIIYTNNYREDFESIVKRISGNILVLGRNNYDIYNVLNNNFSINKDSVKYNYSNTKIRYLTVHKSKGLEEENVILINMINAIDGFPNMMLDFKLVKKLNNKKERYLFEEERRLFYVALTRTKNCIFILVNKSFVSVFIKELIKYDSEYIEIIK